MHAKSIVGTFKIAILGERSLQFDFLSF